MKIPNKRELQQTALNHSSDISSKDIIKIHKKCTAEPYSFLINDTTLTSDNLEKLQYDINREASKISVLSLGKIHKYEYLTGEEILPSNQQEIIEQAKFTYSPLGKVFAKQIKTIEDQGEKQIKALEDLKPKGETKAIEDKSDDKLSIEKETYNRLLG